PGAGVSSASGRRSGLGARTSVSRGGTEAPQTTLVPWPPLPHHLVVYDAEILGQHALRARQRHEIGRRQRDDLVPGTPLADGPGHHLLEPVEVGLLRAQALAIRQLAMTRNH